RKRLPRGLHHAPPRARARRGPLLRARRLGPSHGKHLPRGHGSRQRARALHVDAPRLGRRVDSGARRRALARDVAARALPGARPRARPALDRPGSRQLAAAPSFAAIPGTIERLLTGSTDGSTLTLDGLSGSAERV